MSLRKNKKWIVLAGSVLADGVLAGCGTSGEKIDNATQLLE